MNKAKDIGLKINTIFLLRTWEPVLPISQIDKCENVLGVWMKKLK